MVTKAMGFLTPSLREEDPCYPFLQRRTFVMYVRLAGLVRLGYSIPEHSHQALTLESSVLSLNELQDLRWHYKYHQESTYRQRMITSLLRVTP